MEVSIIRDDAQKAFIKEMADTNPVLCSTLLRVKKGNAACKALLSSA
jgi:hypothetical protein